MKTFTAMLFIVLTVGYLTALAAQQIDASDNLQVGQGQTSIGQSKNTPNITSIWRGLSSLQGNPSSGSSGNVSTASQSDDATTNWSGYDATGGTYTSVTGTWNVPSVSATDEGTSADAAWIGIGGVTSQDLIQIGTQNIVSGGQVSMSAFYEMLPETSEDVSSITVTPGDTMSASIRETSQGQWLLNIKDDTNGESFSNSVTYDSSESSAEWVEEDPSDASSLIPLDNFGTVNFSSGTTTDSGSTVSIAASQAQPMTMMNESGQTLADPSSLGSDGESFSISRTSASTDSGTGQYVNVPNGFFGGGYGGGFDGKTYPGITTYVQFYN